MATGGAPKKDNFLKRLSKQFTSSPVETTPAAALPAAAQHDGNPPLVVPIPRKKGSAIKRLSMHFFGTEDDEAAHKGAEADLDALLEVQLVTPWVLKLTGFQAKLPPMPIPKDPPPPVQNEVVVKQNRKGSIIETNSEVKLSPPPLTRTNSMVEIDVVNSAKSPAKP
jgi:hypothetical protein